MSSIFAELSLGRVVDRIARAAGWSPTGRELRLTSAEGPGAEWLEGRTVKVVSMEGDDLIVDTGTSSVRGASVTTTVRLSPRHGGWTAYSLMLVSIAVVVLRPGPGGKMDPIAIATARLERAGER